MADIDTSKTTWDLACLFSSDNDPKIQESIETQEKAVKAFVDKWESRTDYLQDPAILKEALDAYEHLRRAEGLIGSYAYYLILQTALDQVNTDLKAKYNNEIERITHLGNTIKFFELQISRIPSDKQQILLEYPDLSLYKHFLEQLFTTAPYLLSDREEKIINLKAQPAYGFWVNMLSEFLSTETRTLEDDQGEVKERTFEEIGDLMSSKIKHVRDAAAVAFNGIISKHLPVAEKEINAVLYNKKIDDTLRQTPRPDTSRLLADDFEPEILDVALSTIDSAFDISQRYYRLKANLMGIKQLEYYEKNVPYGDVSTEYPYEKAVMLVDEVFSSLDPQFSDIFRSMINSGYVDVYPQKGKMGGAFCIYESPTLPVMVLLNHTDKLQDVLTIAHEMGHAINGVLMRSVPSALDYDDPKSTAEVASTFMEGFVTKSLLMQADDEERLALMMLTLNNDVSSIFRQVAAYRFEQELHATFRKKGYLSGSAIGELFQKHMNRYMGSAVNLSTGSENWWVSWSHFRSFFYVYSYACGVLISKSLQRSVREDKAFIENVKVFLSSGLSKSPKDLFLDLGIDITQKSFWEQGVKEIEELLNETEELAKKLRKIE